MRIPAGLSLQRLLMIEKFLRSRLETANYGLKGSGNVSAKCVCFTVVNMETPVKGRTIMPLYLGCKNVGVDPLLAWLEREGFSASVPPVE